MSGAITARTERTKLMMETYILDDQKGSCKGHYSCMSRHATRQRPSCASRPQQHDPSQPCAGGAKGHSAARSGMGRRMLADAGVFHAVASGDEAGARTDLLDDAWWGPTIPLPGRPWFCLAERNLPGIFLNAPGQHSCLMHCTSQVVVLSM